MLNRMAWVLQLAPSGRGPELSPKSTNFLAMFRDVLAPPGEPVQL